MMKLCFNAVISLALTPLILAIRQFPAPGADPSFHPTPFCFAEAPEYRNGADCPATSTSSSSVHVTMTLDSEYLRGTIAAIHSVLCHASCPENIFFHLISVEFNTVTPQVLTQIICSVFPYLKFKVYIFHEDTVINLISSSVRPALENPLNYARNYLGEILDPSVTRVIYLDSDIVLVDDIYKLWSIDLTNNRAIGAPEYCHTNFTNYFTKTFWSDPNLMRVFDSCAPCYFNTGVMVIDLTRWRSGNYQILLEDWMGVQRTRRIYELGSLPPFLLVFGGNVEPIDHRWNQHGLGGDNIGGSCRGLHPGPVSLLHWSGKGKPWARLDSKSPCPLDYLWQLYDLFKHSHYRFRYNKKGSIWYSNY